MIDPVLSYATYFGGSSTSAITDLAADSSGDLFLTGWTLATDLHIAGPIQPSTGGGVDAFVAKLNPAGTSLLYATYFGGTGDDRAQAIAVDGSGQAYVTGSTASANFPVANAYRPTLSGARDAFVLKINSIGNQLVYSTFLGGTNSDWGYGIAADSSGAAYVAGDTMSANFPVTSGVPQAAFGGNQDAFIAKLSSTGSLQISTFLGGTGIEHAGGIAIDSSHNAYVAGGTTSMNFPIVGGFQTSNGGYQDAFLTKLNSGGTQFVYSTYLGGSGGTAGSPEVANAVALDASGNAYLAGTTTSPNFPVTAGAFQTNNNAMQEGFVAKVNAAGSALVYCTLLGGTAFNQVNGIAVDASGNAYLAGYTSSGDFPLVAAVQGTFSGMYDAFVTVLAPGGNSLSFSSYFGGTGSDAANAIALDPYNNIYVGGQTSSVNLTLVNPVQPNNIGGAIGWVARMGSSAPPPQLPQVVSVSPSSGSGYAVTLTAKFSDPSGYGALASTTVLVNTMASSNYGCQVTYNRANNQFSLANDVASSGGTPVNPGGGDAQNDQCMLHGSGSYVTTSGNTLTMVVAVTFQPGFTGNETVYLYASDNSGYNTGLVSTGTWTATAPPPQPSAVSVLPSSGLGASQTFTFVFSDTRNALNVNGMAMLFNTSITAANACYLILDTTAQTVSLVWDNGLGTDSKPITSGMALSNHQCSVGATSLQVSGLSNIINASITFKGTFSGTQNIYMFGSENGVYTTGWVTMGTYTVAAGGVPVANGVLPSSGTGPSQRFSFTVSDAGGSGFINSVTALVANTLNTSNACYVIYDRTAGKISLAYDNPNNGSSPVTPGGTEIVSNSQCTLRGSGSSVVAGVSSLVVTFDVTFNANFYGTKNLYLQAVEPGYSSGWVAVGSWTVTGGVPVANSVAPNSGAGRSPTLVFTVSDSAVASNITAMGMLITSGAPTNMTNACRLIYDVAGKTIGLYNDAATSYSTKPIGSSATLSNSQCAVGYTVGYPSGNSMVFQINTVFTSAFNGAKSVYLNAMEPNASSGWVSVGSWTVQ